jgi:hypothetical protein
MEEMNMEKKCANPECGESFEVTSKHPEKRFVQKDVPCKSDGAILHIAFE